MQSRYSTNVMFYIYMHTHIHYIHTIHIYKHIYDTHAHTIHTTHSNTTNTTHMHTHTIHTPLNVLATYTVSDSTDTWRGG